MKTIDFMEKCTEIYALSNVKDCEKDLLEYARSNPITLETTTMIFKELLLLGVKYDDIKNMNSFEALNTLRFMRACEKLGGMNNV